MKKLILSFLVITALALLGGCATPYPLGMVYTGVNTPAAAGDEVSTQRQGTARCTSYLGLIALGDCSVSAAARDGNIQRISHVDYKAKNYLGIYGRYTTTVYGQ